MASDIPLNREITESVDFISMIKADDIAGFAQQIKSFQGTSVSERTTIGQKCESLLRNDLAYPLCMPDTRKTMLKLLAIKSPLPQMRSEIQANVPSGLI